MIFINRITIGNQHIFLRADAFVRIKEFDKAKNDCDCILGEYKTWTDRLRTKHDILSDCLRGQSPEADLGSQVPEERS